MKTMTFIFDINNFHKQVDVILHSDDYSDVEKHRLVEEIRKRFPTEWDIFKHQIDYGDHKLVAVAFEIEKDI